MPGLSSSAAILRKHPVPQRGEAARAADSYGPARRPSVTLRGREATLRLPSPPTVIEVPDRVTYPGPVDRETPLR